jgi:hypothetical protein
VVVAVARTSFAEVSDDISGREGSETGAGKSIIDN